MAFIQQNIPKPNKVYYFSLKDFSGGINNRSSILAPNEAVDLLNLKFSDDNVLETRKGQHFFSFLEFGSAITFIDEYKPYKEENQLVVGTSNKIFINNLDYMNIGGDISGVNFQGSFVFVDGEKLRAFNKFPQEDIDEYIKIIGTPVVDYVIMEIVNPPEGFVPLDTEYAKGVYKYDYINLKMWYEPCQLEIEDVYLGSNVLPENPKYITSHKGRLYVSGSDKDDDNVFITATGNPFYFATSLPLQLPPNSDKVVGMIVYDDAIMIGREEDIYTIRGDTNDPATGDEMFKLERMNSHCGFANNRSFNIAHNFLFFVGSDGIMYSIGTTRMDGRFLHTQVISKALDIFKHPFNFTDDDIRTATSYYYKDEWYVSIRELVLVYSYKHMAWTIYKGLNARCFYNYNDKLIWGNDDGRLITFLDDDYLDFGEPFESYWYSKNFDMDDPNMFKQFKDFFLVAHTFENHNSDVRIVFEIDYADVINRVLITNQLSVWGEAKWGDRWVSRNINASIPFVVGRRGRGIRFKISNGYYVHGFVNDYAELEYYQGRKEGVLVKIVEPEVIEGGEI